MTFTLVQIMTDSCHRLILFFGKEVLYSTVLLIILLPVFILLRNKSPFWRLAFWTLILFRLIIPPDYSYRWSLNTLIGNFFQNPFTMQDILHEPDVTSNPSNALMIENGDSVRVKINWEIPLFLFWISGAAFSLAAYRKRRLKFSQIIKNSAAVQDPSVISFAVSWKKQFKISKEIIILESDLKLSPFTMGTGKPVIVIPKRLMKKDKKSIMESVVAHEMAHIKYCDDLWIHLINLIRIVYFFHPVVWLATRQLHVVRECICDQLVLSKQKISRETYGNSIITVLKSQLNGPDGMELVPAFGNQYHMLRARIQNMKGDYFMSKYRIIPVVIVTVLLGLILLPMASSKQTDQDKTLSSDIQNRKPVFICPIPNGKIVAGYGIMVDPFTKKEKMHKGIDIPQKKGTPVLASGDGKVIKAESDPNESKGYGKYITLDHENGYVTRYAHLDEIFVQEGQTVIQGDKIGLIGETGLSAGPHLHFELKKMDEHINPESMITF